MPAATWGDMPGTVESYGSMNETIDRNTSLLAICIPTRNRRKALERCLASVLPQAESLGLSVSVSDNGSVDDTWPALEALRGQYPLMQIVRHTRDIGFRDNLMSAVLRSRAEYVWPISDKYVLLPGALESVVVELTRQHPDAVVVNSLDRRISAAETTYSVPGRCLAEIGWHTDLLGSTVLPRQAFVDVLHIERLSAAFPNVVALFAYLGSRLTPRLLVAGRACIQTGLPLVDVCGTSVWNGRVLDTWGRDWYDAVMSLPGPYSASDRLQAIRAHSRHAGPLNLSGLLRLRALGQLTFKTLSCDRLALQAAISVPWPLATFISVVPQWMLRSVLHVHPRQMLQRLAGVRRPAYGKEADRCSRPRLSARNCAAHGTSGRAHDTSGRAHDTSGRAHDGS